MNNNIRVKDKREFEDILFNGKKIKNNYYIIYYKERKNDTSRYGITFAKKFGKAYKRNLFKRRLREIIRINQNMFSKEFDYIIIIRKYCDVLNYQEMNNFFVNLMKEAK